MTSKTWFIAGASRGIGRALTTVLLERGATVTATVREPTALADLQMEHGTKLRVAMLDMTDAASITREVDSAFAEAGPIDVVVGNAGYALVGAAEEANDEQIGRQIETNLMGPVRLVRAALPHFRAQGHGHLIQMSSMGGQIAYPGFAYYHLGKWAIEGFFEALAQEVASFGLSTTLVEPGNARTEFSGVSAAIAPAIDAYRKTAAGALRAHMISQPSGQPGDPRLIATAIANCADATPPPRRLVLGSDAFVLIRTALQNRLADLDAQEAVARSTDYPQS